MAINIREFGSTVATALMSWLHPTTGEKIPANVPTLPDGSAHEQSLTNAQLRAAPLSVMSVANDKCVTAVGAAAAAVTVTLPAEVGKFHYIDSIEIVLYSAAARTGGAAPITVTTTNLSGSPAMTFATAGVIGAADVRLAFGNPNRPIKSAVANTPTIISMPIVTGGLWRCNVVYSTGT